MALNDVVKAGYDCDVKWFSSSSLPSDPMSLDNVTETERL